MDIIDLTPQEKSVLLARAMGRYVEPMYNDELERQGLGGLLSWEEIPYKPGHTWELYPVPNLYDPANMSLAKRAIAWGWLNISSYQEWLDTPSVAVWILVNGNGISFGLDKLVIEAGLVAEEERG